MRRYTDDYSLLSELSLQPGRRAHDEIERFLTWALRWSYEYLQQKPYVRQIVR